MDLENIMLSEVRQAERQILHNITYMWNQKNYTNKLIYKTEADPQIVENKQVETNLGVPQGEGGEAREGGRLNSANGINRLLYIKCIGW